MKTKLLSLFAATLLCGLVACDSAGDNNNDKDSTNSEGSTSNTTNTAESTGSYAALADTFRVNSEAGRYRDVTTGKPIRISVDPSTGRRINAETNEPVTRYVYVMGEDWWLYDNPDTRLGRVRWDNDKMMYDDNGNWIDYETKWKDGDTKIKVDEGDGEIKIKDGDSKTKIEKDGDTKTKTDGKKIKTDEDGTKIKDNK
jgi:hypothetical protein